MKVTIQEYDSIHTVELPKKGVNIDETMTLIVDCLRSIGFTDEQIKKAMDEVQI